MKREVVRIAPESVINVNLLETHGRIGVLDKNNKKFIATQIDPAMYILIGEDHSNGLNRKDNIHHGGVKALAEYYLSQGCSVYSFDTVNEMLTWLIS